MTSPCLSKDIRIRPAPGRVRVIFDDAEIASSTEVLELDEPGAPLRLYFPRESVRPDILEASNTHTTCPYKGEASYYTIKTLTATGSDGVWYYPNPCELVAPIADHLAFWGDKIKFEHDPI